MLGPFPRAGAPVTNIRNGLVTKTVVRSRFGIRLGATVSYARHRFPRVIIQHAVSLNVRFRLSYHDVEELLAERGLDVSYETVRRWVLKFGALFARELRRRQPRPTSQGHLDEMAVLIAGRQVWLGARSMTRARFSICHAATARQGSGCEVDAQASRETGFCATCAADRQGGYRPRAKRAGGRKAGDMM